MNELTTFAGSAADSATPPFPADFTPRVHENLIVDFAEEDHRNVILLHPDEARWALTNQTGLRMAKLFDGTRTLAAVTEMIANAYASHEFSRISADVENFCQELYACNLLQNAPLVEEPEPPPTARIPSLTIYITEQCNLRCKHCSIVDGKMPDTLLTADDIRRLIDEHTTNFDNPTVAFLGGEPLMRPDCIDLLEYATARTRTVNMSTNGLYVDEAMADRLTAVRVNLQISLDGADPEVHDFIRGKGSFEKTWAAIERLTRRGGASRLTIATTLTRSALAQVQQLIETCDRLGIGKIRFLPLDKSKAAARNWDRIAPSQEEFEAATRYLIFDAPRRPNAVTEVAGAFPGYVPRPARRKGGHWCPLGETLIVNSQGETYNCPLGTGGDAPAIGNVYGEKLDSMLAGEKNTSSRKKMEGRRYAVEECTTCSWRNFCQGGCAAFITHRSGSFYLNDAACEFRRNLYRENVVRQAEEKS